MTTFSQALTGVKSFGINQIKWLAQGDINDYAVGFCAAFVVTALKIGSWNLLATSGAVAAYTRSETLIQKNIETYCPAANKDAKIRAISKIIPFMAAAATYTGISSLSLHWSLITLSGAIVLNFGIKGINQKVSS